MKKLSNTNQNMKIQKKLKQSYNKVWKNRYFWICQNNIKNLSMIFPIENVINVTKLYTNNLNYSKKNFSF